MAHRMQSEFAERDPLHLAIGRMIFDPILVAAEAVARMKHRGMLVSGVGKLVQAAAREFAEAIEMGLQMSAQRGLQVNVEQAAKRVIGAVEVHPATIGCDVIGAGSLRRAVIASGFHSGLPRDAAGRTRAS